MEEQSASTLAGNKPAADGRTVYFSAIHRDNLWLSKSGHQDIRFLGMDVVSHEQAQALVGKLDKPQDGQGQRVVLCGRATPEQIAELEEAVRRGRKHSVQLGWPENGALPGIRSHVFIPQMPECGLYDLSDTEIAETFSVAQAQIAWAEGYSAYHPDAARQKRRDDYVYDLRWVLRACSECAVVKVFDHAREHHLSDSERARRCRALRAAARKAEADYLVLASLADRAIDGDQDALRELPERLARQSYPRFSEFQEKLEEYIASHMAAYDPLWESAQTALARFLTGREPFSADPNATLWADPEDMRFDPWPGWWGA